MMNKAGEEDRELYGQIHEAEAHAKTLEGEAAHGDEEIRAAAWRLRGVRHQEVDDDGGVYYHRNYPAPPAPAPRPPPRRAEPPAPSAAPARAVPAWLAAAAAAAAAVSVAN